MIPIEILRRVTTVYTHKNCPDGLASAMILKDAFRMLGMSPRIEFLAHGTPEHKAAFPRESSNEVALYCDIAPHASVSAGLEAQVVDVDQFIVLDHHKGAEELVRSFGALGVFADEKLEPGVSGAVLAYREVWVPAQYVREDARHDVGTAPAILRSVQDFAECVGVRDTWQTNDPKFERGQWISKMLMSKPVGWWLGTGDTGLDSRGTHVLETIHPPYLTDSEIETGRAFFEAHEEAVRLFLRRR